MDRTAPYSPAHLSARAYGPPVTRGRVVMYTSADGEEFAALVTRVHSENVVDLAVFVDRPMRTRDGEEVPRGTVHFAFMVGFDHDRGPGTWRWPERV